MPMTAKQRHQYEQSGPGHEQINTGIALANALAMVPAGRAWMVRSIQDGKFSADVGGPPGEFEINRADGDTPAAALLNAIANSARTKSA